MLLSDSEENLQIIVTTWAEQLKLKNMETNVAKCKVLHVTKKKKEDSIPPNIKIGTNAFEVVDQFKYLGTIFSRNGKIEQEIKNRITQATRTYYQINKTIINKKEVSKKTKMQIYQTIYLPTLLYGCETWPRAATTDSQIQAAEMKYLRRVANKTRFDRERNSKIREEVGVRPAMDMVEEKQLKWYGHVKRMGPERITRRVVEAREWEKRSRGRPRKTWLNNIEDYGRKRGKSMAEMDTLTKNRKEWRRLAEAARR